jgi:uncharacterized protein YbjQ (UPF0145 family)
MRFTFLLLVAFCAGCGYRFPENLRQSPDVELYGGRDLRRDTADGLGMVYATADGGTCDEAVEKAFAKLLEQAKALGGTRVIHVQTRARYNWSGRPGCRWLSNEVDARGIAMPARAK